MLFKKMLRDFRINKGAYIASLVLVIIGILSYNMFSMLYESFDFSLKKYYQEYNIGDGTFKVNAMPNEKLNEIKNLKEVKQVEGRIEKRVRLLDKEEEVVFQMISYDSANNNRVNGIELMGGRMPDPEKLEIVIGNNYFIAAEKNLGDILPVIIHGKEYELEIVGYGRSPEFVYVQKNPNELIADPKAFDVAFMPYKNMSELFLMENQVNNVAFTLYNIEDYKEVKLKLEEMLYSYGLYEILPLEDQVSHSLTIQKLDGIGSVTTAVPVMFLIISGFIIFIVIKRIIEQQRTQIGVLKACGVPDFQILVHYISFAFVVGLLGGVIGAYFGIRSVPPMIELLGIAFNMPFETRGLFQKYMINSFLLSVGFAIISGYAGARNCMSLEPAEAMRAPVEKQSQESILDKFYWVVDKFHIKTKLAIRNIFRNQGRSLFIIFGIAITVALLTFPVSLNAIYQKMLFAQFEDIETYHMKITFNRLMDKDSAVTEIKNKPGITIVEPQMILPVHMKNKWKSEETSIICLPIDSQLYNLFDKNDKQIYLTKDGISLSHYLAEKLGLGLGDKVIMESPFFREGDFKELMVMQIIPQYLGANGYMNIDMVDELLEGKDYINSLMVNGTPEGLESLKDDLSKSEAVETFDYSAEIAAGFQEYLQQITSVILLLVVVGMGIGFSVIYVSLIISLSERKRELATMLVVGLSEKEVHQVLIIEQLILSAIGMTMGLPLGKTLLTVFAQTSSSDTLVVPSFVPISAFLFSILFTTIAIIIPQISARRKINQIIVTEALNARE